MPINPSPDEMRCPRKVRAGSGCVPTIIQAAGQPSAGQAIEHRADSCGALVPEVGGNVLRGSSRPGARIDCTADLLGQGRRTGIMPSRASGRRANPCTRHPPLSSASTVALPTISLAPTPNAVLALAQIPSAFARQQKLPAIYPVPLADDRLFAALLHSTASLTDPVATANHPN